MIITKIEKNLWRGPRPIIGSDFKQLRDLGIRSVLNLEEGWNEYLRNDILNELYFLKDLGINTIHVPISEIKFPNKKQIETSIKILTDRRSLPLYTHCYRGVDRTGIIIVCYRIEINGWSFDSAIKEMVDLGFDLNFYENWITCLSKRYK